MIADKFSMNIFKIYVILGRQTLRPDLFNKVNIFHNKDNKLSSDQSRLIKYDIIHKECTFFTHSL